MVRNGKNDSKMSSEIRKIWRFEGKTSISVAIFKLIMIYGSQRDNLFKMRTTQVLFLSKNEFAREVIDNVLIMKLNNIDSCVIQSHQIHKIIIDHSHVNYCKIWTNNKQNVDLLGLIYAERSFRQRMSFISSIVQSNAFINFAVIWWIIDLFAHQSVFRNK